MLGVHEEGTTVSPHESRGRLKTCSESFPFVLAPDHMPHLRAAQVPRRDSAYGIMALNLSWDPGKSVLFYFVPPPKSDPVNNDKQTEDLRTF